MTIQQIRYCLGVASCGSFNKAAEKLFVSQPSLTSSVHDLEAELGFAIFNRTSRGTTVTERGDDFLKDADSLFKNYEAVLKKYTPQEKRTFSVSALYYEFAREAFAQVVNAFSGKNYDFSFREVRAQNVIEDVAGGKSDIGILYLSGKNREEILKELNQNHLEFTYLTECGAAVYLHKNHPLAKNAQVSLEDLLPYRFVTFDTDDVKSFFSEDEIKAYNLNQPITVSDRATELNLIKNLNGYTFLSGTGTKPYPDGSKEFITIPLKSQTTSQAFELGYVTKTDSKIDGITRSFIDAVKEILAK